MFYHRIHIALNAIGEQVGVYLVSFVEWMIYHKYRRKTYGYRNEWECAFVDELFVWRLANTQYKDMAWKKFVELMLFR